MGIIRSTFLGGGSNSAVGRAHVSALRLDGLFNLRGGSFSSNSENNKRSLSDYQVDAGISFSGVDDLVKRKELFDLVHVLTPPKDHHSQLKTLIGSGISLISEKPLVTSVDEAKELRSLQRQGGGFFAVMYNYLGYPMIRELRSKIRNGWLGKVHEIRVQMPQEGFIRTSADGDPVIPQRWRQVDYSIPTISLDLGVHCHMLVKYLVDRTPVSVFSRTATAGRIGNVVDSVNALVDYEDDVLANYWYGKTYLGQKNGLAVTVYGDLGSAHWKQTEPEEINYADVTGRRYKIDRASSEIDVANAKRYERFKIGHPAGFIEAMGNYYVDIAKVLGDCAVDNQFPAEVFGIDESLEGLQLLTKFHESSILGAKLSFE